MVANVQAFGPVPSGDDDETVTVTLNLAECLGAGYSMRALAVTGSMPEATRIIYDRVGGQLVSAAKAEMAARIAKARESGAKAARVLPVIGDLVTEGMGLYRVLKQLEGRQLLVESHVGIRVTIDWDDSGYRDPANAWRVSPKVGAK